jgi:hypothetical protein
MLKFLALVIVLTIFWPDLWYVIIGTVLGIGLVICIFFIVCDLIKEIVGN